MMIINLVVRKVKKKIFGDFEGLFYMLNQNWLSQLKIELVALKKKKFLSFV